MKIKSFLSLFFLLLFISCSSSQEKKVLFPSLEENLRAAISIDDVEYLKKNLIQQEKISELISFTLEANSLKSLHYLLEQQGKEEESLFLESPYFSVRSIEALNVLLHHNYPVNITNLQGESLVHYYLEHRPRDFFLYFLKQAKELDLSKEHEIPFLLVLKGDSSLIKAALSAGANFLAMDSMGNYPIYYTKDFSVIESLIGLPYNPQQKNKRKELVLGEIYLRCLQAGKENLVKKCLHLGVNPNYKSYTTF